MSLFRDLFVKAVETGVPGGKPLKKKVLSFRHLCVFLTSFVFGWKPECPG